MGGLFGGGGSAPTPKTTPAETQALNEAQPYLQEYNSGQLSASEAAALGLQSTMNLGEGLQAFAGSGVQTSGEGLLFGTIDRNDGKGFQAGAGSGLDLGKQSAKQGILSQDLAIGMQYLNMSSGQAADLAGVQQKQAAQMGQTLGELASSFGNILGPAGTPTETDLELGPDAGPYTGPGAMNDYGFGQELVNDTSSFYAG